MKRNEDVHAGQRPSASAWNKLTDEVENLTRLNVEPPLELEAAHGSYSLRFIEQEIWAKITGNDEGDNSEADPPIIAYSWEQVYPVGDGTYEVLDGGLEGEVDPALLAPAYERNNTAVPDDTIVRLYPGTDGEFLFEYEPEGTTAHVRITSTTKADNRYPGKLVTTPAWTDVEDIWVVSPNSEALSVGTHYLAKRYDWIPIKDDCGSGEITPHSFSFTASGFDSCGVTIDGDWTLTHSSGCTWTATQESVTATLVVSGSAGSLTYALDFGTGNPTYVLTGSSADLCEPVTLDVDEQGGCGAVPSTLAITPACFSARWLYITQQVTIPSVCTGTIGTFDVVTGVACISNVIMVTTTPFTLAYEDGCVTLTTDTPTEEEAGCCDCPANCCGCEEVPEQYTFTVAGVASGDDTCGADCDGLNGDWTLTLTGECSWDSGDSGLCSAVEPTWHLFCTETHFELVQPCAAGSTTNVWNKAIEDWDCLGANTLDLDATNCCASGLPSTITITPV